MIPSEFQEIMAKIIFIIFAILLVTLSPAKASEGLSDHSLAVVFTFDKN